MSLPAIEVCGLGKRYMLGETLRHNTLRDRLAALVGSPKGSARDSSEFWALREVDFRVSEGEVLGVIGRNGAGKSTLLKILSRITEPTEGEAVIRGRVGSLLEVGTGFHNELTGRENVYLNGAVLGMTRAEVRRKYDEIVEFAGTEKFMETPVKRYSSGMKVRLAFAVAAFLEPEIMIVDEVLAVGDNSFQSRCIARMGEVANSGRTVLLVSHNMASIHALCTRAILLDAGRVAMDGTPEEVIQGYLRTGGKEEADVTLEAAESDVIRRIEILDGGGIHSSQIGVGEPVTVRLTLHSSARLVDLQIGLQFLDQLGQRVMTLHSAVQKPGRIDVEGDLVAEATIPECRLVPGQYGFSVVITSSKDVVQRLSDRMFLTVVSRDLYGTGRLLSAKCGPYVPAVEWRLQDSQC